MKKWLLLCILFVPGLMTQAQTIGFREENEHVLAIETNFMIARQKGRYDLGVALGKISYKRTGECQYILEMYMEMRRKAYTQEGSRVVFLTFSDEYVTVTQTNGAYESINSRQPLGGLYEGFCLKASYSIQESDLVNLIEDGIKEVRIETSAGIFRYPYPSDLLGGYLKDELALIAGKEDFTSDF